MKSDFDIVPNAECGGWDVMSPSNSDEPLAWFASREGAVDWVIHILGLVESEF